LHIPGKVEQRGFFLFEIDSPLETLRNGTQRPINASSPGFMRRLLDLEDLQLRDGEFAIMRNGPTWLESDDVDLVIDIACDPARRGALVILGTDDSEPAQSYMQSSRNTLTKLAGLATSFVLSPEATQKFNREIGDYHAVHPGAIRTFFPEVDPATDFDHRRHPFLKKERITEMELRVVSSTLENSARRMTLESALPHSVTRVLERINSDLKALELSGNRKLVADPSTIVIENAETRDTVQPISENQADLLIDEVNDFLDIQIKLRKSLNVEHLTASHIDDLLSRVHRLESISPLLDHSIQENSELRSQNERIQDALTESQMDHLETFAEKESLQSQIEYLKSSLLAATGDQSDPKKLLRSVNEIIRTDTAWVGKDQTLRGQNPQSFTDLLYSLPNLEYLEYTGDLEEIESLDQDEIGIYSGKTWEGLHVLNDYARAKIEGHDVKGIFEFLENAPSGYNNRWSSGKYSAQESKSTENNPKLMNQRIFPVPVNVNPTGRILMAPHLKISTRLRVHFYEDVPRTRKIYIGYIGRHLGTPRTN
jgi:hypothetical protein